MSVPIIGILLSGMSIILLTLLFRFEQGRGKRVLEPVRIFIDRVAIKLGQISDGFFRLANGDLFRQVIHFSFHTFLTTVLRFMKRCEAAIGRMLRTNRTLARKVREESSPKNKLDEIAEHKVQTALTQEESKRRRDESLNG